ncbi:hypothetical protein, partial [Streptomyces sp. NPDC059586]|uniref:hypothetical protein n=1 Tax=Streptomyces sp. NPDC059586 TaxID=3346876 RepID=UPI00367EA782
MPPTTARISGCRARSSPGSPDLSLDASALRTPDLAPPHSWPGSRVLVTGRPRQRLIGAEELGDRLDAPSGRRTRERGGGRPP